MTYEALFKEGVGVLEGQFLLKVSRDRLEALLAPGKGGKAVNIRELDLEALHEEMRAAGVVYGLLATPEAKSDATYVVARGVGAVNGENARIKSHVKPGGLPSGKPPGPPAGAAQVNPAKPQGSDQDKVDFHELNTIVNVPKDKLLLEKIPLTEGRPGTTVTGETISPKPGKDLAIKTGPGITVSPDGSHGFAAVEGEFVLVDGKAAVLVEHTVSGDVDYNVGNISFVGQRLLVNGAVQPGFKVKCKGDVFIGQGLQYSAAVTAGGNLEIKGGAIGHEIVIKCWGNVVANFLDNVGRLEVKGELTVTESMIGVRGMVGGNIRVLGGQGVLAGGQFVVGGSVFVKELGSEDEVQTELSVGVNPALEEKKAALTQEKELWAERMNELIRNTTGLKAKQKEKGAAFPAEQLALLKKYNQMLPGVMERVNQLTEAEEKLEAEIEQAASEAIYVYGDLYPGAKITIGGVTRLLTSHEHGVVIHFDRENRQIHCRTMTPEEKQGASG